MVRYFGGFKDDTICVCGGFCVGGFADCFRYRYWHGVGGAAMLGVWAMVFSFAYWMRSRERLALVRGLCVSWVILFWAVGEVGVYYDRGDVELLGHEPGFLGRCRVLNERRERGAYLIDYYVARGDDTDHYVVLLRERDVFVSLVDWYSSSHRMRMWYRLGEHGWWDEFQSIGRGIGPEEPWKEGAECQVSHLNELGRGEFFEQFVGDDDAMVQLMGRVVGKICRQEHTISERPKFLDGFAMLQANLLEFGEGWQAQRQVEVRSSAAVMVVFLLGVSWGLGRGRVD